MSLFARGRPAVSPWLVRGLPKAPATYSSPLQGHVIWSPQRLRSAPGETALPTPGGLRLVWAAYFTAFLAGWLFFALAPVALVGPGLGHLRIPGMLAGAVLAGAATAAFARALRCPWRDCLLLGLLSIALFPVPLLLLARRYRQVRRATFAPLN